MVDEEEELILALLSGRTVLDKDGLPTIQYLSGNEERRARRLLAARLRRGLLSGEMWNQIAALIDPCPNRHPAIERQIEFHYRRAGQQPTRPTRETAIAQHLNSKLKGGQGVSSAIRATAAKFGISERYVWEIWRAHRNTRDLF
jgi:hypothetical protein